MMDLVERLFPMTGEIVDAGGLHAALYFGSVIGVIGGIVVWETSKSLIPGAPGWLVASGVTALVFVVMPLVHRFL